MQDRDFEQCLALLPALREVVSKPFDSAARDNLLKTIISLHTPSPRVLRVYYIFCEQYCAHYAHANAPMDALTNAILQSRELPPNCVDFFMQLARSIDPAQALMAPNHFHDLMATLSAHLDTTIQQARLALCNHLQSHRREKNLSHIHAALHQVPLLSADSVQTPIQLHAQNEQQAYLVLFLSLLGWGPFKCIYSATDPSLNRFILTHNTADLPLDMANFMAVISPHDGTASAFESALAQNLSQSRYLPPSVKQYLIEQCMLHACSSSNHFPIQPLKPMTLVHEKAPWVNDRIRLMKVSADKTPSDSNTNNTRHNYATIWTIEDNDGHCYYSNTFKDFFAFFEAVRQLLPSYLHAWFEHWNTHSIHILSGALLFDASHHGITKITIRKDNTCHVTAALYFKSPKGKLTPTTHLTMTMRELPGDQPASLYPIHCSHFQVAFANAHTLNDDAPNITVLRKTTDAYGMSLDLRGRTGQEDVLQFTDEDDLEDPPPPSPTTQKRLSAIAKKAAAAKQATYTTNIETALTESLAPIVALGPVSTQDIASLNIALDTSTLPVALSRLLHKKLKAGRFLYSAIGLPDSSDIPSDGPTSFLMTVVMKSPTSVAHIPVHCLITLNRDQVSTLQLIVGNQGLLMGNPPASSRTYSSSDEDQPTSASASDSENPVATRLDPPSDSPPSPRVSYDRKDVLALAGVFIDRSEFSTAGSDIASATGSGSDTRHSPQPDRRRAVAPLKALEVPGPAATTSSTEKKPSFSLWQWLCWLADCFAALFRRGPKCNANPANPTLPPTNASTWNTGIGGGTPTHGIVTQAMSNEDLRTTPVR